MEKSEQISKSEMTSPKFCRKHCDTLHIGFCGLCSMQVRVGVGDGLYLEGTNSPVCWYCSGKFGLEKEGFITEEDLRQLEHEHEKAEARQRTVQNLEKARQLFKSDPSLTSITYDGCYSLDRNLKMELDLF